MKTIMVIPGANAQIPLIKKIKELGHEIICVNPYDDSPGFKFADYCEKYDILDVEKCISIARQYNIDGIVSDECDIAMPTVAAIGEALDLNSIGCEMASLYTNKTKMRQFCKCNGFPYPMYFECDNTENAKKFFRTLSTHKMIMKPLDSNSSRGVYTVTSEREIDELFVKSLSFSRVAKRVLCEEYIEGPEFTVDGIVLNGKHISLAVSRKKHYEHHPNIACELFFSHTDDDYDYEMLRRQNDLYVEKTGLTCGFTHAEYKFDGSRYVLIEIGARGGGNYISSHIVPIMTGIDNYQILVQQVLGQETQKETEILESYKDRCCVLKFFDVEKECSGKQIEEIKGLDYLSRNSNVVMHHFNFKIGDVVEIANDDSKRVGFYIAYADSRERLLELMKEIEEKIVFVYKEK